MPRAVHRVSSKNRKKKVLKAAKGYRGGRSKLYRTAKETALRAGAYAYRDRKVKKRSFRSLWIVRINAACRAHGVKYSEFIKVLDTEKIGLNRKMLAELAVSNKTAFKKLLDIVKTKKAAK